MRKTGIPVFVACLALSAGAYAQETQLGSDFRREGAALEQDCSSFNFKSLGSWAYTLFTDHPMHIAGAHGAFSPRSVPASANKARPRPCLY